MSLYIIHVIDTDSVADYGLVEDLFKVSFSYLLLCSMQLRRIMDREICKSNVLGKLL